MGLYSVEKMSKINNMKQICCAMSGMREMFSKLWFGSMNYVYMAKVKEIEHEVLMIKKVRYINN